MPWKIPGYAFSVVSGQICVTLGSTYFLNKKHNTCFLDYAEYYCGYVNEILLVTPLLLVTRL